MILITGSTGLVGSRILFELLARGKKVRALKRTGSDTEFVRHVFVFYDPDNGERLWENIDWFTVDILDTETLAAAFDGVQTAYHTAALVSYHPADADKLIEVNATGTANVVNAALNAGVEKLCYISSVAALGKAKYGSPTSEDDLWTRETNTSNYGLSKFMAEREVWRGTAEGLPAVILNPSIILGPAKPDQSSGMLMDVIRKGSAFYPPGITGYVDVRDVSAVAIELLESDIQNERFLVNGENCKFKDLLSISAGVFGGKKPKYKISFWMLTIARYALKIRELITGKRTPVTKETARSAFRINTFSAAKVKQRLRIEFTSVFDSLASYRAFFD